MSDLAVPAAGLFDEADLVSTYTRKQAVEDGQIVDLTPLIPETAGVLFGCTRAVYAIVERAVANRRHCNDLAGVVWDLWTMARFAGKGRENWLFRVIVKGAGKQSVYVLRAMLSADEDGRPILTIMGESES